MIRIHVQFNDNSVLIEKDGETSCKDLMVGLRKAAYRLCGAGRQKELEEKL